MRWHLLLGLDGLGPGLDGLLGLAAVVGHVDEVDAEALWRPMATGLPTSKFPFISFC